jgi:hypothetical protein
MEFNQKKETTGDFGKKVGLAEFKVLKFNPTRQELNQILGREDAETDTEIVYTGVSSETNARTIRVTVWLQEVTTGFKTPVSFFLEDRDLVSRSGKNQYINAVGAASYVDKEENLQDWFRKAMTYRKAKKGEEELMNFLRGWLVGIELNIEKGGYKNNILLDMNKLFNNNLRELNELITSEYAGTVTALATVKTREIVEEGKPVSKQYQNIYNKAFLPGNCMRFFRSATDQKPKFIQNFIDNIKGEYGCKDFYILEPMRDYVEGENPVSSDQPVLTEKGSDY